MVIIIIAVIIFIIGAIFLYQGFSKQDLLNKAIGEEKISTATFGRDPKDLINAIKEAQKAGDTVRQHRHSIDPSCSEILGGGKYDPTNPIQLTYAQTMNLENYLYLAVASFGLVQVILAKGAFMILTAIAFASIGTALIVML